MNNCPRVGKFFGGCHFEPRYSEKTVTPTPEQLEQLTSPILSYELTALTGKEKIYEGDVCTTCGRRADIPRD